LASAECRTRALRARRVDRDPRIARPRQSCPGGASGSTNRRATMAEETLPKTKLETLQDTLSRLKEMEHYSQTNIEKLAALWLEVSEHKDQKQYEKMVDDALKRQNQFEESMKQLIEAYETEAAQLKAVAAETATSA
jgi:hypothetical protein